MPQFSDENKIYRIPSVQHDQFYKFRRGNINSPDDQRNNSQTYGRYLVKTTYAMDDRERMEIKKMHSVTMSTTLPNLSSEQNTENFTEISKNRATIESDISITENKLNNTYSTISTKDTTFNAFTTQSSPITTTHKQEMTCDKYHNYTLKRDNGIFQYLPIDILKNVHSTLKSQPVSFEGKLHFLKMFEKSLMSEIESRLTATMSSNRKVRGADYHGHGYESHDDHSIGFPSIEGALLAISFLTFAVYLVRLVMLLFRNMSTPMTTTTAAAIFLGKRKRSIDFDDDTARILNII
ncbi:hypothetical protein CAJAP_10207 [Camponotus japonicus]